jgi:unsaturated rhamnogalacturonyl hydrolase
MKTITAVLITILVLTTATPAISQNKYFKKWPKGSSPEEIGNRIAEKYLVSPHSRYGNTRPEVPPTQITYPDVCIWLGGMWFAEQTKNEILFNKLKARFEPLFGAQKNLLPPPNHVDNNVFGALPFELYLKTKEKRYSYTPNPNGHYLRKGIPSSLNIPQKGTLGRQESGLMICL